MKKSKTSFKFSVLLIAALLLFTSCESADVKYDGAIAEDQSSVVYNTSSSAGGLMDKVIFEEYDMDMPEAEEPGSSFTSDKAFSERKIIYSSWFNFQTEEYDESLEVLKNLCDKYGAYFESSESYGNKTYSTRSSRFKIRVPKSNYHSFISEAGSIGTIVGNGENNSDVTENYFDTQARLESAQLREERLLEILKNAKTLDDVLALERELSDVRYEIESFTGTLRKYDSLISYATCTVNIEEVVNITKPAAPTKTLGEKIAASFSNGMSSLAEWASDLVVSISYAIPFIVLVWLPIGIILAVVLILRKKKKAKKTKISEDTEV